MTTLLRRLFTWVYAYAVKWLRTRETVRIFKVAHAQELKLAPPYSWPVLMARQAGEMQAVRAGRLDAATAGNKIVDRTSWQWPYLPASVQRLSIPLLKATPYNIRRMSRTPVPRRAYNLIIGAVISQPWDVEPIEGVVPVDSDDERTERIKYAKKIFTHPNNQDSFQSFIEQGLNDMLTMGAFVVEMRMTLDTKRPIKMWPVNGDSIRIFASWGESTTDMPHYAQMTGLKGERGAILFYDDQLLYIKDNPSTDNPFGLGKMEVAFSSVNDFLGVQGMAGRAGTDQIRKTFMWWESPQNEAHIQIVRRHIQNELEGQAKLSLITGMKKPETVEVNPVTEADLLLAWQEMLIRMIANAFDMSALALGIEHDVNRAVGEVLDDKDFRSAVVPIAKKLQEAFTRKVLHEKLEWYDLQFRFLNLDDPDITTRVDMFSKLYAMNSITPNQILKGLNRPTLDSPLADLTQFECMLLNMEAMNDLQNSSADKASDRQQKMQQQQQDLMPQSGVPGPGSSAKMTPGNIAKGGQPPAPKALALPKFKIAGTKYTAQQLAFMPVNKLTDVVASNPFGVSSMLQAMDSQEPGILQRLNDEVKVFFQDQLAKEQKNPSKSITPKLVKKWQKELAVKVRQQNIRTNDFAQWLYQSGQKAGRPGGGSSPQSQAGKPGNVNPIRKG